VAELGLKELEASIQAHTLPAEVIPDRNESAMEVRPEHSPPTSSVTAPTGKPPWMKLSSSLIPVATKGRTIRAGGVRAEGIFCASADSIWSRSAEAECMNSYLRFIFAFYPSLPSTLSRTKVGALSAK
jgi:hypothetical protein